MVKNKITKEDVLQVAKDLSIELTEEQIKLALEFYPLIQAEDSGATWDLAMEQAIYQATDNGIC